MFFSAWLEVTSSYFELKLYSTVEFQRRKGQVFFTLQVLKVPKRENFLLAFFAQSEPIWVEHLGTKPKKKFF